jgi:hypothetical protein
MSIARRFGLSRLPLVAAAFLLLGMPARSARAIELTGFVSGASPGAVWTTGYGGTLTTTWFHVIALEGEYAKQPGMDPNTSVFMVTGDALVAPPIGPITPYAGLGVGLYHESTLSDSDTGSFHALVIGAKWKFGLLVLKGEYRRLELPSTALLPLHHRISAGVGVSF